MAVRETKPHEQQSVQSVIDNLVKRAGKAQETFMSLSQEQIDCIVQKMAQAGLDKHMLLAKMAVEETGRGALP